MQPNTGQPKPHLDVRNGRSLGLSFELAVDLVTIGRDPASTIRLDDESIDWRHAWVRKTQAGWDIADAESHGITKRNGVVLTVNQWVALSPGDIVSVGEVTMQYSVRPSDVLSNLLAPASVAFGPRAAPEHHPSAPPGAPGAYGPPQNVPTHQGFVRGRLSVRQGPSQGAVAELSENTVIGNHPAQATLVLADPQVSPRHVEIARFADGFYARDLGSHAGTSCRGQRLGPQPFKLHNGDVLVLGQNIALLFEASS